MDDTARKLAMIEIRQKVDRFLGERAQLLAERKRLDLRERQLDAAIMDCKSAARVFEFELELPDELAIRRSIQHRRQQYTVRPDSIDRILAAAGVPSLPSAAPESIEQRPAENAPEVAQSEPSAREIALEQLERAGSSGTTAREIRAVAERVLKRPLHDKTIGMTLYRLSLKHLVTRRGQTWFLAKPPDEVETRNPGVAAPGSEDSSQE